MKTHRNYHPFWRKYSLIVLFGAASILTCAFLINGFTDPKEPHQKIPFAASVLFGFGTIMSFVVAFQAYCLSSEHERTKTAFEFLEKYNKHIGIREKLDDLKNFPEVDDAFDYQTITEDQAKAFDHYLSTRPELAREIRELLGFLEDMALAIACCHASEAVIYRSIRGSVIFYTKKLSPYIRFVRIQHKEESYYSDVTILARAWSAPRSVIDGKGIPKIWAED